VPGRTRPLVVSRDLARLVRVGCIGDVIFSPSKALLESRSIVASRLIVKCGVPSEGEKV